MMLFQRPKNQDAEPSQVSALKRAKILILSFYYPPDLCPGSFRSKALIEQLQPLVEKQYEIEIITTLPNRYATFVTQAKELESQPGITIKRIALPTHHSGMLDQAKAFFSFAKQVHQLVKDTEYSLVFATSSRLMTAVLASFIARKKKTTLYLDIRDIFTDTLNDILPHKVSMVVKPFFSLLERWSFRQAHHINLISKGFAGYFAKHYPKAQLSWLTNGVDPEFILTRENPSLKTNEPLTVLYAGNIGQGQGLELILPELAKQMEGIVHFKIIGDGGRREHLAAKIYATNCTNIELLAPVNRQMLIKEYQNADVLFLHLNDYKAFLKVLPSKIFEYAASGKPIWAGVSGYASEFIKKEISNAVIFPPCNSKAAEECFKLLQLGSQPRQEFIEKYQRKTIMRKMAEDVVSLLSNPP